MLLKTGKGEGMVQRGQKNWVKGLAEALNMGTTIVAAVALGYFGGRWLDRLLDTDPWLTVVGFLLGVVTGIKVMWDRSMSNSNSSLPKKDSPDQE